jgi:hypothetical protein
MLRAMARLTPAHCALGLLLTCVACGAPGPQPVSATGIEPAPPSTSLDACVGFGESRLFAADESRRAVALQLSDGKVAWRADSPGQVVHCDAEVVVVADRGAASLTVRVLDASDGRVRTEREVELPAWARPDNTSVRGWGERDGYGIAWTASTYWRGGYPPSPEEERAARREAGGAFVLRADGSSRSVSGAPSRQTPPLPDALARWPGAGVTWDGRHAHHPTERGERTRVVRIPSGEQVASIARISTAAGALYVTNSGPILFIGVHDERVDQDTLDRVIVVRVFERDGIERWSAELWRGQLPQPVP